MIIKRIMNIILSSSFLHNQSPEQSPELFRAKKMPVFLCREPFGDEHCKKGPQYVVAKIDVADADLPAFLLKELVARHADDEYQTAKTMRSGVVRKPPATTVRELLARREIKRDALMERMKKGLEAMKYDVRTGEVVGKRATKTSRRRKRKKKKKKAENNWVVGMPRPN